MPHLLARSAEDLFWLARYLERVENLARVLDVTETFARDRGGRNWLSVVQINADEKNFFAKHPVADGPSVQDFYLLDVDNPTSVQSMILAAHQNARSLRPILSIEMWMQINVMRHHLRRLTATDIAVPRLTKQCQRIREECQVHSGIVEGSFSRDEAWHYYMLGNLLERADQTTRLLDIKYHLLLPSADEVGSALDLSQWNALLRAAAGYQAFRRLYQGRLTPEAVVGFMLTSETFPRSVMLCVRQIDHHLNQLRSRYHLSGGSAAQERLDEIRAALADQTAEQIIQNGLHHFLDWLQRQFSAVTAEIGRGFFGIVDEVAESA